VSGVVNRALSLRLALAAWLLLTNLSLGLYHRHEATPGPSEAARAHRAAPGAWHHHIVLLGIELDFLSFNTETSPFDPNSSGGEESYVLLSNLLAPCPDHESGLGPALLMSAVFLLELPPARMPPLEESCSSAAIEGLTGLPPPQIALGARSGVQQV
jgi:hypothetical protein